MDWRSAAPVTARTGAATVAADDSHRHCEKSQEEMDDQRQDSAFVQRSRMAPACEQQDDERDGEGERTCPKQQVAQVGDAEEKNVMTEKNWRWCVHGAPLPLGVVGG